VKKKYKHLRVAAKAILFGLIYGRGAKAISREVEKAGVSCSQEDAQGFIDAFFARFPLVKLFIDNTKKQVEDNRFVETLWGRKEFFYQIEGDKGDIDARQKRQGVNFLVQSYVADLLRLALVNLAAYRREHKMSYKLILTVHDSIMTETPLAEVPEVAFKVLPYCMTQAARAPQLGFGISSDISIFRRWDEDMVVEDLLDLDFKEDMAEKLAAKDETTGKPLRRKVA
jgi:DNA polymerase-1